MYSIEADMLHLSKEDCQKIVKLLSSRIGKIVIQAIYAVADLTYDHSSRYAMGSLIASAGVLKELATDEKLYAKKSHYAALCLQEAETLLRATRQRVSGVPPTRELSRLPFELPPHSVRIFCDACEFVIHSLLGMFNANKGFYKNYVIIDTVDGPKHSLISIRMPEHRLSEPFVYTALSHEAFHAFFQNHRPILDEASVSRYIKNGIALSFRSSPATRLKIVEEMIVELLDFEFSYLGNYDNYMKDEWSFFAKYFTDALRIEVDTSTIVMYILRTFAIQLWNQVKNKIHDDSPTNHYVASLIHTPSVLRQLLRDHIQMATDICKSEQCPLPMPSSFRYKMQQDLESMSDALESMINFLNTIRLKEHTILKNLQEYAGSKTIFNNIVRPIAAGQVINKEIQYPHIIILEVFREIRKKNNGKIDVSGDRNSTYALILSLWNAKNITS